MLNLFIQNGGIGGISCCCKSDIVPYLQSECFLFECLANMLIPCVLAEDRTVCPTLNVCLTRVEGHGFTADAASYVGFIFKKIEMECVTSSGRICALTVCLKGLRGGCGAARIPPQAPPTTPPPEVTEYICLSNTLY